MQPDSEGWWNLPEGHYEVVMENIIAVGPDEAGWVITRSTLNRNGVFLTSGLYDTGYNGIMAAMMHVNCGAFRVRRGTRIGQYLSFDAESLSEYKGSYGIGTADDARYGQGITEQKRSPTRRVDFKDMSVDEIAATPKEGLTWYQIKKINAAIKQVEQNNIRREEETRAELKARAKLEEENRKEAERKDKVQATITHVVSTGGVFE